MASFNKNTGFYNVGGTGAKQNINVGASNEAIARALQYSGSSGSAAFNNTNVQQAQANPVINYTPTTTNNSTSSSGNGVSLDLSKYNTGYDAYGSYLAALESRAAERIAALQNAYGASRGTINSAYENSLNNINSAYADSYNLLQQNNASANEALNSSYNNSVKGVNDDAAKSLKEAYVNKMLQQKNIRQQLSAMGLSGGASESTLANMSNNYGNARNNINTTTNTNLSNLAANRDASLAEILQNFNNNLMSLNQNKVSALNAAEQNRASALASIEQALANGIAAAYSDNWGASLSALQNGYYGNSANGSGVNYDNATFVNNLSKALENFANTELTATQAQNLVNLLSTSQGSISDISNSTNYMQYIEDLLRQAQGK